MQPAPIAEINFTATTTKRSCLNAGDEQATPHKNKFPPCIPPPTDEQLSKFYQALSKVDGKPAILSLHPDYSNSYLLDHNKLSAPLSSIFDESCIELSYHLLLKKCEDVFQMIQVSKQQAKNIEIITRSQVQSKLWYIYKSGRITASKFKGAVCTDMTQPFQSLLKSICYPDRYKFNSLATQWGCDHERTARRAYIKNNR